MPIYKRGSVQVHYEEAGSGFPLLVIPGGGLNATIGYLSERTPFNPMSVLNDEYRCITMDLRNANGGGSSRPVEVDRPWESYADDQLGLMDSIDLRRCERTQKSLPTLDRCGWTAETAFGKQCRPQPAPRRIPDA